MTGERTIAVSDHATAAGTGKREDLRFSLAVVLHLLPGALLLGTALLLAPPLIERGVPYELDRLEHKKQTPRWIGYS
jgi:hypothetical protein